MERREVLNLASPETYSVPTLTAERGTDGTASLRTGNAEVSLEDVQLFEGIFR